MGEQVFSPQRFRTDRSRRVKEFFKLSHVFLRNRRGLSGHPSKNEGRWKRQCSKTLRSRKRFPVLKGRTWHRAFVKRRLQPPASERKGWPECFNRPLSLVIGRPAWLLSILAFHEPKIAGADLYFTFQDPWPRVHYLLSVPPEISPERRLPAFRAEPETSRARSATRRSSAVTKKLRTRCAIFICISKTSCVE